MYIAILGICSCVQLTSYLHKLTAVAFISQFGSADIANKTSINHRIKVYESYSFMCVLRFLATLIVVFVFTNIS